MSKSTKETKVDIKKRKDPPKDDESQNRSSEKKQKTEKTEKCQHKFKVDVDGGSDGVTVYICSKCNVIKNGMFNNKKARSHDYTHRVVALELEQDEGVPNYHCETCECLDDTEEDGECKRHAWCVSCDDCGNTINDCFAVTNTIASYITFLQTELEEAKTVAGISDLCECKNRSMTFARGPPHSDTRCGTCLKEVRQSQFQASGIRVTQINAGTGGTSIVASGDTVVRLSR
jgi:hypothetical protein